MSHSIESLSNHELVEQLKSLVAKEKLLDSEILVRLKVVKQRKLYLHEGYGSLADYCGQLLGMSEDQAWRRSQAVDTITQHPWALDMLKSGETKLTQIAMIKQKVTAKNEQIIKDFLPGKSKAEVRDFLETVGLNGERLEPSKHINMKIRLKKETVEKMKRVRELKAKTAKSPAMEDIHDEVYAFWLAHHCPVEKAKRAQQKLEKKNESKEAKPIKADCSNGTTERTRYVKAEVRHAVMVHGEKGCDYIGPNGQRCGSTYKLQFNHRVPFAQGGANSVENGEVLCAPHNQYLADLAYGRDFMDEKRTTG